MLTDIVIPGMNGLDLAARIKQEQPQAKILYMSGYSETAVHQVGSGVGTHEPLIKKPCADGGLGRRVHQVLSSTGPATRPDRSDLGMPGRAARVRDRPARHM